MEHVTGRLDHQLLAPQAVVTMDSDKAVLTPRQLDRLTSRIVTAQFHQQQLADRSCCEPVLRPFGRAGVDGMPAAFAILASIAHVRV